MNNIEEEREFWRKKAKEVGRNVVAPLAMENDWKGEFSWEIADAFSEAGFLSILIPKEYGGMNGDITSFCIVSEEIAYHCASSAILIIAQAVGTLPVVMGGSSLLKETCLTKLAKEKGIICFCLTEPGAGSDAASIQTKAEPKGDYYLLNGRKMFITNGGVSDYYTVFAVTQPGKRMEGITGFLLERSTPGLSIGKKEDKMGFRSSSTTEVVLEDAKVPASNRIGEENGGWWLMMRTLNRSRPAIGAQAVGLAQGAFDYGINFFKEKGWFQKGERGILIRSEFADLAIDIEAARSLVYKAAEMIDEKAKGTPVQVFSSMSKYFASDVAMKVTTEIVQMMEWEGLLQRNTVERMMRDAKLIQIFEGTNQIQRMVISHTLLKSK